MPLFKNINSTLTIIKEKAIDLEKDIQQLTETNLDNVAYNNSSMQAVGRWFHKPFENKVLALR